MKSGKASGTAKVIAAATILLDSEGTEPNPTAPGAAELCRHFLSTCWSDRMLAASASHPITRRLWRWVECRTHPGIIAHYWNRKRWIELRCREAIAGGTGRIVIPGAGFDTLGLRLARELEHLEVIEVDHPATRKTKLDAIQRMGIPLPPNLHFMPVDLTTDAFPILPSTETSVVYVLEGLLMYLDEPTIDRLFGVLQDIPTPRLRVIFSFMTKWPDASSGFRPRSRWIDRWLEGRGEPFTWSLEPDRVADFLATHGFTLDEMASTRELANLEGSLDGENLVVCERR